MSEVKESLQAAINDAVAIMTEHANTTMSGGERRGYDTSALLRLAEAYAWTISTAQPHGGPAVAKT